MTLHPTQTAILRHLLRCQHKRNLKTSKEAIARQLATSESVIYYHVKQLRRKNLVAKTASGLPVLTPDGLAFIQAVVKAEFEALGEVGS